MKKFKEGQNLYVIDRDINDIIEAKYEKPVEQEGKTFHKVTIMSCFGLASMKVPDNRIDTDKEILYKELKKTETKIEQKYRKIFNNKEKFGEYLIERAMSDYDNIEEDIVNLLIKEYAEKYYGITWKKN